MALKRKHAECIDEVNLNSISESFDNAVKGFENKLEIIRAIKDKCIKHYAGEPVELSLEEIDAVIGLGGPYTFPPTIWKVIISYLQNNADDSIGSNQPLYIAGYDSMGGTAMECHWFLCRNDSSIVSRT